MTSTPSSLKPLSALLSFTAENARSYRDEVNLSLLAGRLTPKSIVRDMPTAGQPVRVLPAVGIFGANASGKSTLLKAMADLRSLVVESFQAQVDLAAHRRVPWWRYEPFGLVPFPLRPDEVQTQHDLDVLKNFFRPTRYEVDLIVHGVRWQYGLEVGRSAVVSEYGYHYPNGKQALVFRRERSPVDDDVAVNDDVVFGPPFRKVGRNLQQFVRPHVPLLSVAGAAAFEPLAPLFAWFQNNLHFNERADREGRVVRTVELLEQQRDRERVLALLRAADLGIVDAVRDPVDPEVQERAREASRVWRRSEASADGEDEEEYPLDDSIQLIHSGPWGNVELSRLHESMGTLVWVGLIGPVLDALERGSVLLVDELDASLHPHLVRDVIWLFQSPRTNPSAAQLIFNAHDVTLLGDSKDRALERDQIWITEKQSDGVTTVYPLSDFRPRHDEAIERRYMQGRYGGVPIINPAEYVRATEPAEA